MIVVTRIALRLRWVTLATALLIMAGGVWAYQRLPIELIPDIDFPLITIYTLYPQAAPEKVLQDVTVNVEEALSGMEGLRTVQSISSQNLSLVIAEFDFGTNMDETAETADRKLKGMTLAPGVQAPQVGRFNVNEFPILQLSVLRPGDMEGLQELVRSQVVPAIEAVPGVSEADVPVAAQAGLSITRTNGEPSLAISVLKDPDANTVEVVKAVMERLEEVKRGLPPNVQFITVGNQAPDIEESVQSLQREATLGALFAVAVIFVFLRGVRPTLVTSVAIPVSILAGLMVMKWQGMSLNILTMGGLAVAVGRVVDDSIVVMENIYRHIQAGEDRVKATVEATREVAGAIAISTLTTVAVFIPLAFLGGILGAFFPPFALTIVFALLASLVVALTVVPVLGSMLIRQGGNGERETWLQKLYTPSLRWALAHKGWSILGAVATFLVSLTLLAGIPRTFLPGGGERFVTAEVALAPGTGLGAMLAPGGAVEQIEGVLEQMRKEELLDTYQVALGGGDNAFFGGGGVGGSPNAASVFARLTDKAEPQAIAERLRTELRRDDRRVVVNTVASGGPASDRMELVLIGKEYAQVVTTANGIVDRLKEVDGLANVSNDALTAGAGATPLRISRFNGEQAVTITGTITIANTQAVDREVSRTVREMGLPAGVEMQTGGVFQDIREAFLKMGVAMLVSVALVYGVMVVTLRSLMNPFVIILSLPLAAIGALAALFVTQRTLGLPALIGMLMLIGLVVTNAIVLIVFVQQLRSRGLRIYDALMEGGRVRLRPILMTAFTTSFALLPLAVTTTGGMTIIGAELATVVIGGLTTSTLLTLVVIPVVYTLLRKEREPSSANSPIPGSPAAS
ncbi:MAG: efflux RND transporter permease subunit [Chloroflexi bacterium]|nr:efflux RND transporter permease subunit [Chloroflexota bacterium]